MSLLQMYLLQSLLDEQSVNFHSLYVSCQFLNCALCVEYQYYRIY